ncbi:MAG: hypothetical protein AAGA61_02850 [Pseudomonadota bacterium]
MATIDNQPFRQPSAQRWLVLVALVLSQLAYAAHDCEPAHHEHTELQTGCDICLQFDRDDDVLPFSMAIVTRPGLHRHATVDRPESATARRFSHYLTRASPLTLRTTN